jgi:MvaI/BcnI restriction endonuclease family
MLQRMMFANGVTRLLVKELAPNDNSKNQPYVARGNLDAINILPTGDFRVERTGHGNETLKAPLSFYWLQSDGTVSLAPGTQVILYPQYPEIRLSGFLSGANGAPSDIMNTRAAGRLLFLGTTNSRRVIAWASFADSALARAYAALGKRERLGVFSVLPLVDGELGISTREILVREIRRIHRLDWIDSKALTRDGSLVECKSSHCVGYTLEAELGVARNGISEPDFRGWEVKATTVTKLDGQPSSKAVTLMTPEPTGGYYRSHGAEAFVRKFGYPDKKGRADRRNFGGIFLAGVRHVGTKLTMTLDGFDSKKSKLLNPAGSLALLTDQGAIAAEWSFASLMSLWNRKHAQAVYVPAEARTDPRRQYRYGGAVRVAEGTDFLKLLEAIALGAVYYDPGIKTENESTATPRTKRRSQFRIKSNQLSTLYTKMEQVDIFARK